MMLVGCRRGAVPQCVRETAREQEDGLVDDGSLHGRRTPATLFRCQMVGEPHGRAVIPLCRTLARACLARPTLSPSTPPESGSRLSDWSPPRFRECDDAGDTGCLARHRHTRVDGSHHLPTTTVCDPETATTAHPPSASDLDEPRSQCLSAVTLRSRHELDGLPPCFPGLLGRWPPRFGPCHDARGRGRSEVAHS